jgi:uncharacterized OB-fold protein
MINHGLPPPAPSTVDRPFWDACARHELVLRHCPACARWHHPPLPLCPECQHDGLEWRRVTGPARLYSWTRVHVAGHPTVDAAVPYYVAVIEFPGCGGTRIVTRLDHDGEGLPAIGEPCELIWVEAEGGQPVPAFRTSRPGGVVP